MNDKKNTVLNLDEMLGTADLKVSWLGKEYPLKTQMQLSPDEYMEIMTLGEKFTSYQDLRGDNVSKDILESVDRLMQIIAPELAEMKIPFQGQMLVLTFWKEQQQAETKKKRARAG